MTRLRIVATTSESDLRAARGQKSHATGFVPRVVGLPVQPDRAEALVWWSRMLMRHCGSAHDIARMFDVTEQTGRNWLDGVACPTGLAVLHAMRLWPEEFAGWCGEAA